MIKKTIIVTGGFGTIGFALSKSLLEQGHKVILITSIHPGEGKTFCSVNLSTILARKK